MFPLTRPGSDDGSTSTTSHGDSRLRRWATFGGSRRLRVLRPVVAAQFVSFSGAQVTSLALPALAVLYLHVGPFLAATLFACQYAAQGIASPFIGVVVDSSQSPKSLLIGADVCQFIVLASVPVAYSFDAISAPLLLAVAGASGVLAGITDMGIISLVPRLVASTELVSANSAVSGARAIGQTVGPTFAGIAIPVFGPAVAMLWDAVGHASSAAILTGLPRTTESLKSITKTSPVRGHSVSRIYRELGEGIRTLLDNPVLMWLALAAGALNLGGAGIGSLYMINAYEVLGLTPTEMSATVVVYSLSAIVGVSTARSITHRLGLVRSVALLAPTAASALFLVCAAKLVLPLASLVVYEMVFGYCATVWVVSATTLQQRILPTERLGRVVGLTRTVSALAIPIGALGAGALAEAWHLQATLLTCASLATVTTAFAALRIFIGGFRDGGDRALTAHAGHA